MLNTSSARVPYDAARDKASPLRSAAPHRRFAGCGEWEYRDILYVLDRRQALQPPCGEGGPDCGSSPGFAGPYTWLTTFQSGSGCGLFGGVSRSRHIFQSSSELWECGNPEGISKECGKGGKPAFWLSMLSTFRHFHGLFCCAFSNLSMAFVAAHSPTSHRRAESAWKWRPPPRMQPNEQLPSSRPSNRSQQSLKAPSMSTLPSWRQPSILREPISGALPTPSKNPERNIMRNRRSVRARSQPQSLVRPSARWFWRRQLLLPLQFHHA